MSRIFPSKFLTNFFLNRQKFIILLLPLVIFFSSIQSAQAHAYSASFTTINLLKSKIIMTFALDEVSVIELTHGDVNQNGMLDSDEFEAIKNKIETIIKENVGVKIDGEHKDWSKLLEMNLNRKGDATQLVLKVEYPPLTPSQSISLTDSLYQDDIITNYVNLLKVNYGKQNSTSALSGKDRTWSMILSESEYAGLKSDDTGVQTGENKQARTTSDTTKQQEAKTPQTSSPSGWITFLKLGMTHILEGYDHLLFLLALLIARQSFKQFVKVITAFTIAHSLTLTLTVLGIISVPASIVEPAIALSICYVAIENIFRKSVSQRWALTFIFGLIHGMGFADLLTEMKIPKGELAIDLASFNIGIEIIQLIIVVILLPLLTLLHRSNISRKAVISVSTIAFVLGSFWLIERIVA
ncbi:HupE/UreJ family protein [Neobacillus sp. 114]|uniref:HupE/UreJ family protein n=1 Tax=Neobacillus sp. 114 TaxID=3048535 RepID=UPI0024C46AF0|nr:HupE/UreJ family protein [Neobacillus sp. 114]